MSDIKWTELSPSDPRFNDHIKEQSLLKRRTLRLEFGMDIHQVDNNTIEIEVGEAKTPFTEEFIKHLQREMGMIEAGRAIEEMVADINRRLVLATVKVK